VDINAQNEQLPDLLMYLSPIQTDGPRQCDLGWERGCERNSRGEQVFEEGGLDALGQGVGNGQLGHVVFPVAQGDEVVVDAGLVFARVVEVEVLGLDVVGGEFFGFELGDFGEEALFLGEGHAPDYDGAVVEEEDFGCVDGCVEVLGGEGGGVVLGEGAEGVVWG